MNRPHLLAHTIRSHSRRSLAEKHAPLVVAFGVIFGVFIALAILAAVLATSFDWPFLP